MILNYMKVALRNLRKHKAYTLINVAGLSVGMACCLIILLYVQNELSYDSYHEKSERIFRVLLHARLVGQEIHTVTTAPPMAAALKQEYPEVEEVTRLDDVFQPVLVTNGNSRYFNESRIFFADSTFFDIFSIKIISGDASQALVKPNSIVLTESSAQKYFGNEYPIGKTLTFDNQTDYNVTAVSEDVPANSHFHYDLLASFTSLERSQSTRWVSNNLATYLTLRKDVSPEEFESKLPHLVTKYVAPQIEQAIGMTLDEFFAGGGEYRFSIEPVTGIHFSSVQDNFEPSSNPAYVKILAVVAIFILILACVNFTNLATARSANRAREVGIRKVVGSSRSQLIRQFVSEAMILSSIALGLTIVLVQLVLPGFNNLANKNLAIDYLGNLRLPIVLMSMTIIVGFLAGTYPAFFLSRFNPVRVLKGKGTLDSTPASFLRNALVIFQFTISTILVVGTLVVRNQLEFMQKKDLGFDKEHVLLVKRATALGNRLDAFQTKLRQTPGVLSTAATWHVPGRELDGNGFIPEGAESNQVYLLQTFTVGYDFIETLDMELAAGRSFSRDFGEDSAAYVLNEAAVHKFGWDVSSAIGKEIFEPDSDPLEVLKGPVIGVLKDFHFNSLHEAITPAILRLQPHARFVLVRLDGEELPEKIARIQTLWQDFAPDQPFEYSFLDDDFDALYRSDQRIGKLVSMSSLLGIIIACLGLFGLASFTAEQRTKEIGVRKVLGASVPSIILLLSKEFTKLVALATILAFPLAYFAMEKWLQGFAYRTTIGALTFLLAGAIALLIAYLTVGYRSILAALINPTDALRYE